MPKGYGMWTSPHAEGQPGSEVFSAGEDGAVEAMSRRRSDGNGEANGSRGTGIDLMACCCGWGMRVRGFMVSIAGDGPDERGWLESITMPA